MIEKRFTEVFQGKNPNLRYYVGQVVMWILDKPEILDVNKVIQKYLYSVYKKKTNFGNQYYFAPVHFVKINWISILHNNTFCECKIVISFLQL